jgi:hypothetical protein
MDPQASHPSREPAPAVAPGRLYPWVLVAAGGLMGCVAVGAIFALAVFLQPWRPTRAGRAPASPAR